MNIQVSNSRKLLVRLVGIMRGIPWEDNSVIQSLHAFLRVLIGSSIRMNLPAAIKKAETGLPEIGSKPDVISDSLREAILPDFEDYGLTVPQFHVTGVSIH